jgi:hypothetical protein
MDVGIEAEARIKALQKGDGATAPPRDRRGTNVPDGTSCADSDLCNGAETCQSGTCTAGTPLSCDDGNPCTTDSCNPATGCVNTPSCDQVIASDGFESGNFSGGTGWLGSWSASGDVSIRTDAGPQSGSWHVRLRRSTGLLTRSVNLAAATNVRLRFWAKVTSFESSDSARVRVSANGSSYTTVKTFTAADSDNTYHFHEIPLSGPYSSNYRVRFDADMSGSGDQWYIDGVEVVGTP